MRNWIEHDGHLAGSTAWSLSRFGNAIDYVETVRYAMKARSMWIMLQRAVNKGRP
jgi:hypothetical protein